MGITRDLEYIYNDVICIYIVRVRVTWGLPHYRAYSLVGIAHLIVRFLVQLRKYKVIPTI
jgi:hypothetical protein